MPTQDIVKRRLAASHGYAVVASDGLMGEIDTPLFPPDSDEPDYLVVKIGAIRRRRPVMSTVLVDHVDAARGLVYVRGRGDELAQLPEHLPLAI
jgi:hypothetical protein